MYIPKDELTLTEEDVESMVNMLVSIGDLSFQSKANRAAVVRRAKQRGITVKQFTSSHQLIDPRYTAEGTLAGLPDKGLANDTILCNLYSLEVL